MDNDWKKKLNPEEYHVLREKGTEKPFSGKYNAHFEEGTYSCKGCNSDLFDSTMKFEAHCGWPSFDNELEGDRINKIEDSSFGMTRTEIVCNNCGSHLGHIFNDGPTATNLRYCVNSISINFIKTKKK